MKTLALLMVMAAPLLAESRWHRIYRWSVGAVVAGMAADSATSWGRMEANPILRDGSGRFGGRGLALKSGLTVGGLVVTHLVVRKQPALAKPAAVVNFAAAGVLGGVAIRNERMNGR